MLSIKSNLLSCTLLAPLAGAFVLLFVPSSNKALLKRVALNFSCLAFTISLFLWVFFNKSIGAFQFVEKFSWISILNVNFPMGVDGISLFFIILTTLLIPICLLTSWESVKGDLKKY